MPRPAASSPALVIREPEDSRDSAESSCIWVWDRLRPRFLGEDFFFAGNHPELEYVKQGVDTSAIAHWGLRSLRELTARGGQRWDVGDAEAHSAGFVQLAPDKAAIGKSCKTLQRR